VRALSDSHCAVKLPFLHLCDILYADLTSLCCPLEIRTAVAFAVGPLEGGLSDEVPAGCPKLRIPEQPKCMQLGCTYNKHHPLYVSQQLPHPTHKVTAINTALCLWNE
jgi:hypothetical protein